MEDVLWHRTATPAVWMERGDDRAVAGMGDGGGDDGRRSGGESRCAADRPLHGLSLRYGGAIDGRIAALADH